MSIASSPAWRRAAYHFTTAILLGVGLYSYFTILPQLPERIPVHFDIFGHPDRWSSRDGGFEGFLIFAGLPWGMTLLLYGIAALLRLPAVYLSPLINLPYKERVVKLPPEARRELIDVVRECLFATVALLNGLFFSISFNIADFCLSKRETMNMGSIWMWLGLVLAINVIYIVNLFRQTKRLVEDYERRAAGDGAGARR